MSRKGLLGPMSHHYETQILRSKLIAMTRLTQRTTDYAIKTFQLGRPELCRVAQNSREEASAIRSRIANHGRTLLAAGTLAAADSRFVCAALRISSALEVVFDAASNIARDSAIRFAEGWTPVSAELADAGYFINRLLRLCVLSLLKRDLRHAREFLNDGSAGQSFDLAVYLVHHDLAQRISPDARFELAVVRCLDAIAGQVREIADALLQSHEEIEGSEIAGKTTHPHTVIVCRTTVVPVSMTDVPGKAVSAVSAVSSRPAHAFEPGEEVRVSSRSGDPAGRIEDTAQARLMRLQQRVCELLIKNQQLRMALITEKAGSLHDQLC